MSETPNPAALPKLLPDPSAPMAVVVTPVDAQAVLARPVSTEATAIAVTSRKAGPQMGELSKEELEALAQEFGVDPARYATRQHLVAALHDQRQLIASLDRDALSDVLHWAGRPSPPTATREQLAIEILRVRSMQFDDLSPRGLYTLARLRGCPVEPYATVPKLIRELKRQEGFFARMNRKRRAWIGSVVEKMIGEEPEPARPAAVPLDPREPGPAKSTRIKEDIEQSGLFGGIANRVKKSADSYLNQKLDEIEARIDRKLDEIDRRLAEWRDKEIANRIRILKITLWASVIVATISLIYGYLQTTFGLFN